MDITSKLDILAMSAKYDVSCSSSGSSRSNIPGGIGNAAKAGICHSWADDGRCISLLKIMMSNNCMFDCAYCVSRKSNDIQRATLTPDEIADVTINFYKRNYIEGLFLSSAVFRSPDYTMEMLIKAIEKLRKVYRFNGYIHIKAMPGADPVLIRRAGFLADRMSANIELPTESSLRLLAPDKSRDAVLGAMKNISSGMLEYHSKKGKSAKYIPAGQSTQLIVGASPESDMTIIKLSEAMYRVYRLKRVYYSAFIPVAKDSRLPALPPPLRRENRLYQADWLLRFYGFSADELLNEKNQFLDHEIDPKSSWAIRNRDFFPVEVNRAEMYTLLRVPGIGVRSAQRIVKLRRVKSVNFDDLKKLGVVLKRARYFITCSGKTFENTSIDAEEIKHRLIFPDSHGQLFLPLSNQLLLPDPESGIVAASGEL